MTRWEPNAAGRLAQAALELYSERGFEQTTVAEIAGRAGLTERTFFRHFADKREVLFAGADMLQELVVTAVASAPGSAAPIDAAAAGVEAEIGRVRFLVMYLLSAVGGSVAFYLIANPDAAAVGASGAIFGVMGAYYVLARLRRWDVQQITVLLPNPFLDSETGKLRKTPDWARLAMWDSLRARWLGLAVPDPVDRAGKHFRH